MTSAHKPKIRVNCSIHGEAAKALLALKSRGIVTSNRDAVIQGILALDKKRLEKDLKSAQLRRLKEIDEVG